MTSTLLIIIGVVLVLLAVGFVLVPYLKQKGLINAQSAQAANQFLSVAGLILQNLNLSDKTKSEADTIFGITQKVVQYVEQTASSNDNGQKKQLAIDTTKAILGKFNIQLTTENEHLIEVGIESAVNALPNTSKISMT